MAGALRRLIRKRLGFAYQESMLSPIDVLEITRKNPTVANVYAVSSLLKHSAPVRFHSELITNELILFVSEKQTETLLVCFTDKHASLFGTIPSFLQNLGDETFDVLVVHDRRRGRYGDGIEGMTDSFLGTIDEISKIARSRKYKHIQTYGTSMGGYVALRAGIMLSAKRAVSVGGSFISKVVWRSSVGKFFPNCSTVCACQRDSNTEIIACHSLNSHKDSENAQRLLATLPDALIVGCNSRKHNIFDELRADQTDVAFLREILSAKSVHSDIHDKFLHAQSREISETGMNGKKQSQDQTPNQSSPSNLAETPISTKR